MQRFKTLQTALAATLLSAVMAAIPAWGAPIQRPIMSRITPNYPEIARRMHIEGTVVVELTAMPDGSVKDVHALSGHPLLVQAAEDCVSHWRFLPTAKAERGTISILFTIGE